MSDTKPMPTPSTTLSEMLEKAKEKEELYDGPGAYTVPEIVKRDREENGELAWSMTNWRRVRDKKLASGEWIEVRVPGKQRSGSRIVNAYVERDEYEKWQSQHLIKE